MPILNYTTKIDPHKTVGEVQKVLAGAGALFVNIEYADGDPTAVMFSVLVNNRPVNFRLPTNWRGVLKRLDADRDVPGRYKTQAQAQRVAWRIIKDWVEAQMAIIDSNQAELAEVFLPYAVDPHSGQTLYARFSGGLLDDGLG